MQSLGQEKRPSAHRHLGMVQEYLNTKHCLACAQKRNDKGRRRKITGETADKLPTAPGEPDNPLLHW
jgi:hypothetical protein